MKIVACVCTYNRPEAIARCLASLQAQEGLVAHEYRIVVVDNSLDHSARPAIEAAIEAAPRPAIPIALVHQREPGVVAARNAALDAARSSAPDAILFTDDDCIVPFNWVATGIAALTQNGVPFVTGTTLTWVDAISTPPRSNVCGQGRVASGATSNLLLDAHRLGAMRFDTRFARTGGEDRFLTLQLARRYGRGLRLDGWAVHHVDPPERASYAARVAKFRATPLAHFRALWWSGHRANALGYVVKSLHFPAAFVAAKGLATLPIAPSTRHKADLKASKYHGRTLGLLAILTRREHDYF